MAFTRIDHVALDVADLARSVAFYERTFGFKTYNDYVTPTGLKIAYLKLGGTVLELVGHQDAPMQGFHFCLHSDDFDGAVHDLQAAGVELVQAPHKTGAREPGEETWRRVVFRGPDGEHIEIRG
ncbi:VOC family protein [Methylocella sp. CPCC 101449]|uniref:VOC family protein n=1 Tax=Methylocella sp. CPCC 101449 TaxID=2987531 RepID=UPI00288DF327|nr:VOC family protein [Methylocella sp. CPCC 101449]MDT2023563.1 VOC family protein [Methylocella sp. CPCC 101449]HEV2573900.1 VOC family protein [Beijerinckiaceae bacterium]